MADVADGRLGSVSWPGAPFHRAGERAGPRLRPEPLHERDAPALRCAEQAPREPRVRRRPPVCVRGPRWGASFAILGWSWRHPRHKVELKDFPNVERWYNQLMARPATKRGLEAKLAYARL